MMFPFRDIALTLLIAGLLPVCFARPWIGVLVWSWLAYMNPHRLVWGFAYNLPFSLMVAIATLGGLVFSRDRRPFVWSRETITLMILWVWFTITTVFAEFPDAAWWYWGRTSKILLMTLVAVPLIYTRERVRWLLLVIAGSLGFYALKALPWVFRTGGESMVVGAPGQTFVSSNNDFALALNMGLPLFLWLAREEKRRWLRNLLYVMFFAAIVGVIFTYSRGGVLGLAVVLAVLFVNRRITFVLVPTALVLLIAVTMIAPERWMARMETISHYEQDTSAMGRLTAWGVSLRLARDHPIMGGGFWVFNNYATFARYAPGYPTGYHDAHSIYFNLLGEHGWIGLGLFVVLMVFTFGTLRRLRRLGRKIPELQWVSNYAYMLQASLVGYLATGVFLSVAYFDLAYQLLILVPIIARIAGETLERPVEARKASAAPAVVSAAKPRSALTPWRVGVR